MAQPDEAQVNELAAIVDALVDPTPVDLFYATLPYDAHVVGAVGIAHGAGGGGDFNGGTITEDLIVDAPDLGGGLRARLANDHDAYIEAQVADSGATNTAHLTVSGTGGDPGTGILVANGSVEGTGANLGGGGTLSLFTQAGTKGIDAWDDVGNTLRFALLPSGQPMVGVVAEPADGDLSPSQMALWFDDTNGAAKLMVKAKTANGTVVTGNLALT